MRFAVVVDVSWIIQAKSFLGFNSMLFSLFKRIINILNGMKYALIFNKEYAFVYEEPISLNIQASCVEFIFIHFKQIWV